MRRRHPTSLSEKYPGSGWLWIQSCDGLPQTDGVEGGSSTPISANQLLTTTGYACNFMRVQFVDFFAPCNNHFTQFNCVQPFPSFPWNPGCFAFLNQYFPTETKKRRKKKTGVCEKCPQVKAFNFLCLLTSWYIDRKMAHIIFQFTDFFLTFAFITSLPQTLLLLNGPK